MPGLNKKGTPDRSKIAADDSRQIKYWMKSLGVSKADPLDPMVHSVQRHLFKADHPKCLRCSCGQINATSLHERAAVIDPDSDASSALLGCDSDIGAEGLCAMSGSHRPRIHSFARCGSSTVITIMRGNACLCKYGCWCKSQSKSHKYRTDHSAAFHGLPRCVTLRHPPSSVSLLNSSPEILRARVLISREITRPAKIALALRCRTHPVRLTRGTG